MELAFSPFEVSRENTCSSVGAACRVGRVELLDWLLEAGAPLDVRDNRGWSALHEAAYSDHVDCLSRLLQCERKAEIDVDWRTHDGSTALLLACNRNNIRSAKVLLECGANVNLGSFDERLPIIAAAMTGNVRLVRLLLQEYAADSRRRYWNGWSALHEAVHAGHHHLIPLLVHLGTGIPLDSVDEENLTPFFTATQYNRLACLRKLLGQVDSREEAKRLLNIRSSDGASCVYMACQEGYDQILSVLLGYGADPDCLTSDERVHAAAAAAEKDYSRCLELLMSQSSPAAVAASDQCPVLIAADNGSWRCLKLLLDFGLDANRPSPFRRIEASYCYFRPLLDRDLVTPLAKAATKGRLDCVELLLEQGARVTFGDANDNVFSPLLFAVLKRDKTAVLRLFLETATKEELNSASSDSVHPLVADAMLMSIHPLYRTQLKSLLLAGMRPSLRGWCACKLESSNSDEAPRSLISQLTSIYTPQELKELLLLLCHFDFLPNCCDEWKTILEGDNKTEQFSTFAVFPSLKFLCRRYLTSFHPHWRTRTSRFCDSEQPLPKRLVEFVSFAHLD